MSYVYVGLFENIKQSALKSSKFQKYIGVKMANWRIFPENLINFSSYGLRGKQEFLRKQIQEMNNTDWIVCPVQLKDNNSWDIQIGVTGKCKNGIETYESMQIELEEELGLCLINRKSIIVGETVIDLKGCERTIFKIHVNQTMPIEKDSVCNLNNSLKDDINRKIGCLVYGSKDDLEKVINKTNKIRYYLSNKDNIIGMAFVSVETIKRQFEKNL
jgi:hypothetical protein